MKNRMKKFRKRIFGVVFTLVAVFSIFAFLNTNDVRIVKAADKKLPTCVADAYEDNLSAAFDDKQSGTTDKLRNIYHIGSTGGTFVLESTGEMENVTKNDVGYWYSTTSTDTTDWITTWVPSKDKDGNLIKDENGKEIEEGSKKVSFEQQLYVTVHSDKVENPPQNIVLTFRLDSSETCKAPKGDNAIKVQIVLPMDDVVKKYSRTTAVGKQNKFIPTDNEAKSGVTKLCDVLKKRVTLEDIKAQNGSKNKITEDDLALFDESLVDSVYYVEFPYCWQDKVLQNMKAKTVRKKIKNVLKKGVEFSSFLEPTYTDSFNKSFNDAKFRAGGKINADGTGSEIACATNLQDGQQAGHCFDLNSNSSLSGTKDAPITLKCNNNTTSNYRTQAGYNFENSISYYAFKTSDDVKVSYNYYKTGSKWSDDLDRTEKDNGKIDYNDNDNDTTVCSKVCEEAVDVEYGPPVIAKAGRCFEYRVRVTSRIKCKSEINEDGVPKADPQVCSPAPVCVHIGKKGTSNGSGPTEDFEACVQKCDGGKYTQKCSTKCYNEVYKDSINKLAVNYEQKVVKLGNSERDVNKTLVTKADFGKLKMDGNEDAVYEDQWNLDEAYYSVDSNNKITYNYGLALWYYFNQYTAMTNQFAENLENYGKYGFYEHEGVKRMLHKGFDCTAECQYISCGDGYYNQADIDADLEENRELYYSKLRECQVQSTCTTKDASFSMSTEYNGKTVLYPGPSKEDGNSVHSNKDTEPQQVPTLKYCEKGQTGGTCADNSVVYDYAGCYKTNKNEQGTDVNGNSYSDKFYQTEITYPGTWINDKRQEMSYKKPQSTTGWTLEKQQFCLPTNAQDVNKEWWLWYIQQTSKNGNYEYENEYGQKCLGYYTSSSSASSSTENTPNLNITPNIFASVKEFGHFGWYFNVQCFYALDSDPSKDTPNNNGNSSSTSEKCDTDPYNYRVRSVDLTNLFPGNSGQNTRTPGFNWTSAATLSKATTVNGTGYYNVNPAEVVSVIQQRGDSIFDNDNYIDYWFHLDNTALNLLRNYNKQRDGYTDYSGDFYTDTDTYGFTRYKSNLFNYSGSASSGNNILGNVNGKYVKAVGNLLCNNDGFGDECETFK